MELNPIIGRAAVLKWVGICILGLGLVWGVLCMPAKRPPQHVDEPVPGGGAHLLSAPPAAPFKVTRQQVAVLVDAYPSAVSTNVPAPVKLDPSDASGAVTVASGKRWEQAQVATNAAEVYEMIFAQLKTGSCKKIMDHLKELIGKKKYTELTPAEKEELRNALNSPEMREVLELLQAAASKGQCQFKLDYSKGLQIELPHLGPLMDLVRLAGWSSVVAADASDVQESGDWIAIGLKTARDVGGDDLIMCRMVQIVSDKILLDQIGELARSYQFPEDQAYALLGEIAKRDYGTGMAAAFRQEAEMQTALLKRLTPDKIRKAMGGEPDIGGMSPESIRRNLEMAPQYSESFAELLALPYDLRVQARADQLEADMNALPDAEFGLVKILVPAYSAILKRSLNATAELDATFAAETMAVYRATHGRDPGSFEDLREVFRQISSRANKGR